MDKSRPNVPKPVETRPVPAPRSPARISTIERVQTLQRGLGNRATSALLEARGGIGDTGVPLPHREALQRAFGPNHDLSTIAAHVGGRAGNASRALGAEAYAVGDHVAFEQAPSLALVAHEVTHVVQDRAGLGHHADNERVADAVADRVAHGQSVAALVPAPTRAATNSALQRKPKAKSATSAAEERDRMALLANHPWLAHLANVDEILDRYAALLALRRRSSRLQEELAGEITEAREDRVRGTLVGLADQEHALDENVRIDVTSLLAADAIPDLKDHLDVGRQALYAHLLKRGAYVQLQPRAIDASTALVRVYLEPSWEVPVRGGAIHLDALLAIQQLSVFVYMDAILKRQLAVTDDFVESNPAVIEMLADSLQDETLAQEEAAAAAGKELEPDVAAEIKREQARYASDVREQYAAATAPIGLVLEILLPAGPLDVLLSIAPVGRIGKGAFNLGKKALQLRKVAKTERELAAAAKLAQRVIAELDDTAISFIKLGEKVAKKELLAGKRLAELGLDYSSVRRLLAQSSTGRVEIEWLAKLATDKKLGVGMIERITVHEANIPWDDLRKVIDNAPGLPAGTRDSVMSKLVGVLGEEAGEKLLGSKAFAEKLGKTQFERARRGVRYPVGRGSIDLVASHDGNFVFGVFAEVKNYAAATWRTDLKAVLDQLDRHNAGITSYFAELGVNESKHTNKVLMVAQEGFDGLTREMQVEIMKAVRSRGWRVEKIPQKMIRTGQEFIDALR